MMDIYSLIYSLISSKKNGIQSLSSISLGSLISLKNDAIQSVSSISLGFLISPLWWLSILSFLSTLLFSLACSSLPQKFPLRKEGNEDFFIKRLMLVTFSRELQFQKNFWNDHH